MFADINFWGVTCLILGLVLVGVEIYTPGIGVPGAAGMVLLALCIVLTANTLAEALIVALIMLVLVGILLAIGMRARSKIILENRSTREEGFSAVKELDDLLGMEGVCATPLRPAGTVEIDGQRYDVVSDLEFVEAGETVKITAVEGRRVVARRLEDVEK